MAPLFEPQISLIVPVLNEESCLSAFLESLTKQRDINFEVIFCDGGSNDGTLSLLSSVKPDFSLRIFRGEKGRGCQMNRGARNARGKNLLFLHVDSLFGEPDFLRKALQAFESCIGEGGSERIAGHFPLRFLRSDGSPSLGYYFYECKTYLNRPGSINGDQGMLMRRAFFQELGGFDESLGFLEDERMSRAISACGRWILLPGEILTSARRFETEGLYERQLLNALIMNFSALGWDVFFGEAVGIYRHQHDSGRLELLPFFNMIVTLLRRERWKKRLSLWYGTGAYVNENAWQLAFFQDVRHSFRKMPWPGAIPTPRLKFFDSHLKVWVHHPVGFAITAFLTWCWFHGYRALLGFEFFGRR